MREIVAKALEYLDAGWSVIPITPETKRPCIKWQEFQTRQPSEEEIIDWFDRFPGAQLALVTGEVSGVVVVDCDNEDAVHAAADAGMRSPIRVRTKRGLHLYFTHPRDGRRRGPRAGVNVRQHNPDWPRVPGLDFRGDGSYALLPPSSGYEWDILAHHDMDDMPEWQDWVPRVLPDRTSDTFNFHELDLSSVPALNLDEMVSEWDRTAKFVAEKFPTTKRIPSGQGNGRNERVMRFASECILEGIWGPELRLRCAKFMREFFEDPLPEREFEATCASMEEAERRNHPERFDEDGNYLPPRVRAKLERAKDSNGDGPKLIQMGDAERLMKEAGEIDYLVEPWLPAPSIVQVYGYSGSGKSLFVQHCMTALACGAKYFGPFEVARPARVLYLDFENGKGTIARRLMAMREQYGEAEDRLNIWAPFDGRDDINLRTAEGMMLLKHWIEMSRPDVVVIDTIRTAFPGLEENSAEEWSRINSLAIKLRNSGISVIMLHHSNKPTDGPGREAGSTNQLTPLETQIRVAQVYRNEQVAEQKGGLWDENYERPVWPQLERKLDEGQRLLMVLEIRYGKVREHTDLHDPVQWIGLAEDRDGKQFIVSSRSTKQKIKEMGVDGFTPEEIADLMRRPVRFIYECLEISF